LECKEIIEYVKDTIKKVKSNFRIMLPELITQKCESLQAKLKAAIKRLSDPIFTVKD
jgi:effector-binding domain-containing protein